MKKNNQDFENNSGSQFNMGIGTLERIHNLIQLEEYYNQQVYLKGAVMLPFVYQAIIDQYKELRPFLTAKEKEHGEKEFIQVLDNNKLLIDTSGWNNKIIVKSKFKETLKFFGYWIRDKLHETGLLMKLSDDPGKVVF